MSGQCTAILGSPGSAPIAISSMLGWVAAVKATESPSQLNPALIQRMWTVGASASVVVDMGVASSAARGYAKSSSWWKRIVCNVISRSREVDDATTAHRYRRVSNGSDDVAL